MKILLIAGHGAGDPGATAKIDGKTYKEAELTREVVANLKPKLEAYGAKVAVYPTTRNAYPDSQSGKLQANADFKAADYILEIHFNAGRNDLKGDGKVAGDECYWPSRGKATGLEKPMTSRLFKGYAQRQSKSGAFSVINTSATHGKKANLLEVCFIDDADDMRIYLKSKDNVAQNIADGVAEYYGLKKAATPTTTAPKPAAKVTKKENEMATINNIGMPTLKKGDKDNGSWGAVHTMQALLIARGFFCGKKGADGDFGADSEKALNAFSDKYLGGHDGRCGIKAWTKLLKG